MKLKYTSLTAILAGICGGGTVSASRLGELHGQHARYENNKVYVDEDGNRSMMPYSPSRSDAKKTVGHQSRRELYSKLPDRILKIYSTRKEKVKKVNVEKPSQANINSIKNQQRDPGKPLKVGVAERTSIPLAVEQDSASVTCVQSDDAAGLKLLITDLVDGPEVTVSCPGSDLVHKLSIGDDGNAWTHTCSGDTVCINIVSDEANGDIGIITEYGYMVDPNNDKTRRPSNVRGGERGLAVDSCSIGTCYEDAACQASLPSDPNAIAGILYRDGRSWYICSGALINNPGQGGSTGVTPKLYFLTANHCVSRHKVASTLEARGGGCPSACPGSCPGSLWSSNASFSWDTSSGAQVIATSHDTDATLLELNGPHAINMAWLGWTTIIPSSGDVLSRLSHPSGYHQYYSTHEARNRLYNCGTWNDDSNYINSGIMIGDTTGGSSGSALTNSDGQVVGQLKGACGDWRLQCQDASDTVDGRFSETFQNLGLAAYLDTAPVGGGTCNVITCNTDADCPNCARGCKGGKKGKTCKA